MGKFLEVREYDTITCNPDYKHDSGYRYLPENAFEELVQFIHEFGGNEENADALDFFRMSYSRNVGETVCARNYVGLIQMQSGYQIQILPKISLDEEDSGNRQTKRIFLKMLKSMRDFPCKVFSDANLKVDRMNLYEIFINMYVQEVRQLVKRGLKSGYVRQEDNLRYYKGKLMVKNQIRTNLVHRERFFVNYDEFHPNRPENRLIKSTLMKLQKLTSSAENAREIRQLLSAFEMVEESVNYAKDFSAVSDDRSMKDYRNSMAWSKVFLTNRSFSAFSGDTHSRALLFPMERVYESYIAQQIRRVMGSHHWEVSVQDQQYYLFTEPRRQFALRPDIVMQRSGRVIVMDTKWKSLVDNERRNYNISQADMYQMYAYSRKYQTSEIWLLYPLNDEMRNHAPIEFRSDDHTHVHVWFTDLAHMEENLEQLRDQLERTEYDQL